jgi:hypothetical protein
MAPTTTVVVRAARWRRGGVIGVVSGMASAWQRIATTGREPTGIPGCGCLHPALSGEPPPQRRTRTTTPATSAASAVTPATKAIACC